MTRVKLKEQYISYLPFLQTLNNISVIMLLRTFNIISLILDVRKGDYVIEGSVCLPYPQISKCVYIFYIQLQFMMTQPFISLK